MDQLSIAQAIVQAGDSLAYAIVVAAVVRGVMNK